MTTDGYIPRIVIATGTRADWGLLLPLARELRQRGIEPVIAATHAHLFKELGSTVNEIMADGFTPLRFPTRRPAPQATADAIEEFSDLFTTLKPHLLVVLGDRFEILGAATAALLQRVDICHIAGGNVSRGAFDNSIRNALTQMASIHLPETRACAERIKAMGIDEANITAAGSAGVYNAMNVSHMSLEELEQSIGFPLGPDFLTVTLHPATLDSVPATERMSQMLDALTLHMQENPDRKVLITYPNSDSDPAPLITLIEAFQRRMPDRTAVVPSLGRIRYLSAAALSHAIVGNSSSAIEETPSLGVPTLDIGIRQQGRERGPGVFHCEADTDSIVAGLRYVTGPEAAEIASHKENPYFIPDTPRLQTDAILSFLSKAGNQSH